MTYQHAKDTIEEMFIHYGHSFPELHSFINKCESLSYTDQTRLHEDVNRMARVKSSVDRFWGEKFGDNA